MNKIIICALALVFVSSSFAQKKEKGAKIEPYKFETIIENPITQVKNQAGSGTCWCFSGISFFESEILRATGDEYDLSEMFVISNTYYDKALKYVRLHGNMTFSPGGSFNDALYVLDNYGIVPENEMPGLNYGTCVHMHLELDEILKSIVSAIVKNPNGKLSTAWKKGFRNMTAAYLGEIPESFVVDGMKHNPLSYLKSLGIDMDNYVDITSWTHSPFYETMVIEVPDNWRGLSAYNVPLDDLISIIDNAIENGYTVAWAADISEIGFTEGGIAVVPDVETPLRKSDKNYWLKITENNDVPLFTQTPCPELTITQELRQEAFDNYSTTDDHGMHIFGLAKDQNETEYYMVKNSWGDSGDYDGIWYVSKAYVRYKTLDIIVNKNAIQKGFGEKLGL